MHSPFSSSEWLAAACIQSSIISLSGHVVGVIGQCMYTLCDSQAGMCVYLWAILRCCHYWPAVSSQSPVLDHVLYCILLPVDVKKNETLVETAGDKDVGKGDSNMTGLLWRDKYWCYNGSIQQIEMRTKKLPDKVSKSTMTTTIRKTWAVWITQITTYQQLSDK